MILDRRGPNATRIGSDHRRCRGSHGRGCRRGHRARTGPRRNSRRLDHRHHRSLARRRDDRQHQRPDPRWLDGCAHRRHPLCRRLPRHRRQANRVRLVEPSDRTRRQRDHARHHPRRGGERFRIRLPRTGDASAPAARRRNRHNWHRHARRRHRHHGRWFRRRRTRRRRRRQLTFIAAPTCERGGASILAPSRLESERRVRACTRRLSRRHRPQPSATRRSLDLQGRVQIFTDPERGREVSDGPVGHPERLSRRRDLLLRDDLFAAPASPLAPPGPSARSGSLRYWWRIRGSAAVRGGDQLLLRYGRGCCQASGEEEKAAPHGRTTPDRGGTARAGSNGWQCRAEERPQRLPRSGP